MRQGRGAGGQQRRAPACLGQTDWKCNTQTRKGAGQQGEKGHREEEPKGGEGETVPRTEECVGTMPTEGLQLSGLQQPQGGARCRLLAPALAPLCPRARGQPLPSQTVPSRPGEAPRHGDCP